MNKFHDTKSFINKVNGLGILTGERTSGKTTGLKLYSLNEEKPTIWLTRYANSIPDVACRWLSDLQTHDLAVEYSEEIAEKNSTYHKYIYRKEGIESAIYFAGLSAWRKLRGVEFSHNMKKPWAIIFDEFVSDIYLPNEPKKLIDLWNTVSRRDEPPKLILSGNADSDGTPYNEYFDISFFEESEKKNLYIERANGYGYEETPFAKMIGDIMPAYNDYASGKAVFVDIDKTIEDAGDVLGVYQSAISIHDLPNGKVAVCLTERKSDVDLILSNGAPSGFLLSSKMQNLIQDCNEAGIIYNSRKAVRLWAWLTKYAK